MGWFTGRWFVDGWFGEDNISIKDILEAASPVGMVVLTEDGTNPKDLGLPGTWEVV